MISLASFWAGYGIVPIVALIVALQGCGDGGGSAPAMVVTPESPPTQPLIGPAWLTFGGDAQHTALGAIATQPLNRRLAYTGRFGTVLQWQRAVDSLRLARDQRSQHGAGAVEFHGGRWISH